MTTLDAAGLLKAVELAAEDVAGELNAGRHPGGPNGDFGRALAAAIQAARNAGHGDFAVRQALVRAGLPPI